MPVGQLNPASLSAEQGRHVSLREATCSPNRRRVIEIPVFDGFDELDAVGPSESVRLT